VKEHFECGHEDNDGMPNIWLPDGVLPGFKETCLEFYRVCHSIELEICRALAVALRLPEDYFARHHTAADNQLRLLHYPSVPAKDLQNETIQRISQHSDYGTITLLFQDDTGGLEIEDPSVPGLFRPTPPIHDTIIVNTGDFLQRWLNDTIKSPVHRVRAPPGSTTPDGMVPARYSIPYFCSVVRPLFPSLAHIRE